MQHLDAALHVFDGVLARFDERAQAGLERLDMAGQQAGLHFLEQRLHHQQGVGLAGVKPQAWQLLLVAGSAGIAVTSLHAVPFDGRVQPAAHVFKVAFERGERDLKFLEHAFDGDDLAPLQEAVYPVKPFRAIHGPSLPLCRLTG